MTATKPIRCPSVSPSRPSRHKTKAAPHWTEQEEGRLRGLAARQMSAAQIAVSFGGKTRNAILGKMHRLGLRINGNFRPHDGGFWSRDGNLRKLEDYYNSPMGYSNPEIAAELGCGMGTLRRGLEKMRASGQLTAKTKPHPAARPPRLAAARALARAAHPPALLMGEEPLPDSAVSIFGLNGHTCRWPVRGQGWNMLYCGEPIVPDTPYCGPHCRRAYAR